MKHQQQNLANHTDWRPVIIMVTQIPGAMTWLQAMYADISRQLRRAGVLHDNFVSLLLDHTSDLGIWLLGELVR